MIRKALSTYLIVLFFCFYGQESKAIGTNTEAQWLELETPHFYIVYEKEFSKYILRWATYAEMAYEQLHPIYTEAPSKTTMIFLGNTDLANGFATFLPYPFVTIFTTLPQGDSSINYYDNWMYEVILHEYAHILTFEPSNGFYYPLRYLFGGVVKPNALLPLWFQEGTAVLMESYFTRHGRLRSPLYSAQIRALAKDKKLLGETLDQMNESSIPTYPYGQRPYFLGALLSNEIINKSDINGVGKLNQSYSRRIPFLINNPMEELTGKDYLDTRTELFTDLEKKAQTQMEKIRKERQYDLEDLKLPGTEQSKPQISPDGKLLAYVEYDKHHGTHLKVIHRNKEGDFFPIEKVQTLFKIPGGAQYSWHPNSKKILFNKLKPFKRFNSFFDLYEYDLESKKMERLTEGLRGFQASYSPKGNEVVFVKNHFAASTMIKTLDLKTKKQKTIIKAKKGVRLSYPTFVDNDKILFLSKNRAGYESVKFFNRKTKEYEKTALKRGPFRGIKKISDGYLLLDERSGATNISLAKSLYQTPQPITNTETKIYDADLDKKNNNLYVAELTSQGKRLFRIKNASAKRPTPLKPLVKIKPSLADPKLYLKTRKKIEDKPYNYNGLSYLLPRYWIPFIYPVDGGLLLQGSTTVADPVGHHALALEASYDTVTERASYSAGYLNSTTKVDLLVQYAVSNNYVSASSSIVTDTAVLLNGSFFLSSANSKSTGSVSLKQVDTTLTTTNYKRLGPGIGYAYNNLDEDAFLGGGNQHSFFATHYAVNKNSTEAAPLDYSYDRLSYSLNQYIEDYIPKRHSILFQLKTSYSPQLKINDLLALGDKTTNGNYLASLLTSSFLMRGYPSGEFIGNKMININLEYHFPLFEVFSGFERLPFFLKKVRASLFLDSINLDGAFYNFEQKGYYAIRADKNFLAAGLEFKVSTTIGWHLPMDLILGAHYGMDPTAGGGDVVPFIGLGITGFGELSKKPKIF